MKTFDDLESIPRHWTEKAVRWADAHWDDNLALVRSPLEKSGEHSEGNTHLVRDTIWYTTGLLMRQQGKDVTRALRAIEAIMSYQFDTPSAVYHGTFRRFPEEALPPENPVIWQDYDPNWREFICTIFIIMLIEFETLLPENLQDQMKHSIYLAAEGSFARKVDAKYSNIALMSAYLLDYAGATFNEPTWEQHGQKLAQEVYDLFAQNNTFHEYNSPTYYGVDFYALALWRQYGRTDLFRSLGEAMEAALWRDTAAFYHAGMRNVCGPFDRSYGMDMTDYIAVLGLWIATAVPAEHAPLPDVDVPFNHAADYFYMPPIALLGTKIPDDVIKHFTAFQGERTLERTIEPNRTAIAWLSDRLMLGGSADFVNSERSYQYHPATVHWKPPDGSIGWIRTRSEKLIGATVSVNSLHISGDEPLAVTFEISVNGAGVEMIQGEEWVLPGLKVRLNASLTNPVQVVKKGNVLTVEIIPVEKIDLYFEVIT